MPGVPVVLKALKPEVAADVGDDLASSLRRRRKELGLLQTEVARSMDVSEWTLMGWEKGRKPMPQMYPRIIAYLGREPWNTPQTLPEQLLAERLRRGLSREQAARTIGVDECTLWWWESGRRAPNASVQPKIHAFLGNASHFLTHAD